MQGLDFLGAVSPSRHAKDRAQASGKRAIVAAQKIAKRAPRLAAAIARAGQKAVAVSSAKSSPLARPAGTPSAPTAGPLTEAQRPARSTRAAAPTGATPARRPVARTVARPMPAKRRSGAKVGADEDLFYDESDEAGAEQRADVYSRLADAATKVADFMARVQDLVAQLPANLPLAQNGLGVVSQLENWFLAPVDAALQGDQAAMTKAQAVDDVVQFILDQESNSNLPWPWAWISNAEAYLRVHGSVEPVQEVEVPAPPGASPAVPPPAPGGLPTGQVARLSIAPKSIAIALGVPQPFTVAALSPAGAAVTPASVTWSVSPAGGTIDQTGTFTATSPGRYVVSATADGVTATAVAFAQASMAAPVPSSGGPAGYGSPGSVYPSGGDVYSSGPADYGYDEESAESSSDDEMYAEDASEEEEEEFPEDEIGRGGGGRGGGGRGGGGRGGGGRGGRGGRGHTHHRGGHDLGPVFYTYPWVSSYAPEVDEVVLIDDLAEAVVDKLRRPSEAAMGLDFMGEAPPDLSDFNRRTVAERKTRYQSLKDQPRAQLRAWAEQQATRIQSRYDGLSWIAKNTPILSRKYDGVCSLLEMARTQLKYGDAEPDEAKAKPHYILALLHGTDAAGELADAQGTRVTDDLVELMTTGTQIVAKKASETAVELARKAGEGVAQGVGVPAWLLWGGVVAAGAGGLKLYLGMRR